MSPRVKKLRCFPATPDWSVTGLWIGVGLFSLVFSIYHLLAYRRFDMHADIAIYTHELWSLVHGQAVASIWGGHFLGDHQHFLAYLLVPLFTIFPHPLFLTTFQSIALGLGAFSVYYLGLALLNSRRWSCFFACLYLLYPPLWNVAGYEFHFEALVTPILLTVVWAYVTNRFGVFILCIVLALACKENISAVIVAFGFFALFQRGCCRWGLVTITLALGWLLLLLFVIQPAVLVDRPRSYWSLYQAWGQGRDGVLFGIVTQPHQVIMKLLLQPEFLGYHFHLLLPVGFLPIFRPTWLLIGAPIWVQHFLSSNSGEHTVWFHYTAPVIPFVFAASIAGLQKIFKALPQLRVPVIQRYLAVFLGALTVIEGALSPSSLDPAYQTGAHPAFLGRLVANWQPTPLHRIRRRLIDAIPPDASVVSSDDMLIHVVRRPAVYTWYAVLWPYEPLEAVLKITPVHRADYLLIDFCNEYIRGMTAVYGTDERWRDVLQRGNWQPVVLVDGLTLWSRTTSSPVPLYEALSSPPSPQFPVGRTIASGLRLLGLDMVSEPLEDQQLLTLHLYWEATSDLRYLYSIGAEIKEDGNILNEFRPRAIGYGILPTIRWKKGMQVKETQTVLLHPPKTGRVTLDLYLYTERVLFYDAESRRHVAQFRYRPVMNRVRLGSFRIEGDTWFPTDGVPLPVVVEGMLDKIDSPS